MPEIGTMGLDAVDESVADALAVIEGAARIYREVVAYDLADDARKLETAAALIREVIPDE